MTRVEQILFFVITACLWGYLGFRVFYVPLIHDEALTYYSYIQDANFIPPWSRWDANNHILYSAITTFFTQVIGSSAIWVIRLASWLSFIPLVWGVFYFAHQIASSFKRWMLILPLIFAPYLLEFFALARGYGMGIGLFICCLWMVYKYTKSLSIKWLVAIGVLGFLGSLANLSMIVSVLLVYIWVGIYQLVHLDAGKWKTVLSWLSLSVLSLVPLIIYGFILRQKGLLYYGNSNYQLSIDLLAQLLLGKRSLGWVWLVSLTGIFVFYFWKSFKNGWRILFQPQNVFAVVLILSVVAIILQYFILGIKYPSDRSILHLFVLLVFSLVFLPVSQTNKFWTLALGVLFFFPVDFSRSMNVSFSRFWNYEHIPLSFSQEVNLSSINGYPPTINGYELRDLIWSFQQKEEGYFPSSMVYFNHPDEWADFVLVDSNKIQKLKTSRFDTVRYDAISGQYLLKQKVPHKETLLWDTVMNNLKVTRLKTELLNFEVLDSVQYPIAIYLNFEIESKNPKMHSEIAFEITNQKEETQYTHLYKLGRYSESWNQKRPWKVKSYFPVQSFPRKKVKAYFKNPKNDSLFISRIECKLFKITQGFE